MSASSSPTLQPRFASATAMFAEIVLLPTPPLPEPTSTTFLTVGTRSFGLCCLAGEGRALAPPGHFQPRNLQRREHGAHRLLDARLVRGGWRRKLHPHAHSAALQHLRMPE